MNEYNLLGNIHGEQDGDAVRAVMEFMSQSPDEKIEIIWRIIVNKKTPVAGINVCDLIVYYGSDCSTKLWKVMIVRIGQFWTLPITDNHLCGCCGESLIGQRYT